MFNEFGLESQNDINRHIPLWVTYCKEKTKIFCIVKMSHGQLPVLSWVLIPDFWLLPWQPYYFTTRISYKQLKWMEIYACSPEVNCWEVRRERERTKVIHLVSKNSTWIKKTFLTKSSPHGSNFICYLFLLRAYL